MSSVVQLHAKHINSVIYCLDTVEATGSQRGYDSAWISSLKASATVLYLFTLFSFPRDKRDCIRQFVACSRVPQTEKEMSECSIIQTNFSLLWAAFSDKSFHELIERYNTERHVFVRELPFLGVCRLSNLCQKYPDLDLATFLTADKTL